MKNEFVTLYSLLRILKVIEKLIYAHTIISKFGTLKIQYAIIKMVFKETIPMNHSSHLLNKKASLALYLFIELVLT